MRKKTLKNKTEDKIFPVAGMGASAGDLEAFEQFFRNMPPDSGMGFVLVPHLDPSHASLMTDLLKRYTKMEVFEAKDGLRVKPSHLFVTPPIKIWPFIMERFNSPTPGRPGA